jgi:hypothetical protein
MALLDTKFGDIWAPLDECTLLSSPGEKEAKAKEVIVYMSPDGHYVGADGFVVPMGFDEFITRYPDYVKAYAYKHMHRLRGIRYDPDTFEDVASELTLFLFALSPGRKAYREGKRSYVECFDPFLQFGAKKGQFFNYINLILSNRFSSYVYNDLTKDPSLNGFHLAWTDGEGEQDTQESHLVAQVTAPRVTMEDQIIGDLHVEALIAKAKTLMPKESAQVEAVLRSVLVHDKRADVATAAGLSKEAVSKILKRLREALTNSGILSVHEALA